MSLRSKKIALAYENARVETLYAAIDELCCQGWDGWEEAREELNELLACVKRCEAQVEDMEKELGEESSEEGKKRARN